MTIQSVGLNSGDAGYANFSINDVPFRNPAVNDVNSIMVLTDDTSDGGASPLIAVFYADNLSFNIVSKPGRLSLMRLGGLLLLSLRSGR